MKMLTILLLSAAIALTGCSPDDSDGANGSISGMEPHVDAKTGCEYLSVAHGGITPRLDRDGHQICTR